MHATRRDTKAHGGSWAMALGALALAACTGAQIEGPTRGERVDAAVGAAFDVRVSLSGPVANETAIALRVVRGEDDVLREVNRIPWPFGRGFDAAVRCNRAGDVSLGALDGATELARLEVRCARAAALRLRPYTPPDAGRRERVVDDAPLRLVAPAADAPPSAGAAFLVLPLDGEDRELEGRATVTADLGNDALRVTASADEAQISGERWSRIAVAPNATDGPGAFVLHALDVERAQGATLGSADAIASLEVVTSDLSEVDEGGTAYAWVRARDASDVRLFGAQVRFVGDVVDSAGLPSVEGDLLKFERGAELVSLEVVARPGLSTTVELPIGRVLAIDSSASTATGCSSTPPASLGVALALAALLRRRRRARAPVLSQ